MAIGEQVHSEFVQSFDHQIRRSHLQPDKFLGKVTFQPPFAPCGQGLINYLHLQDLGDDLIENADQEAVAKDTYIVNIFSFLLNIFNQEYR